MRRTALVCSALALSVVAASNVHAAHPGDNGRIAYYSMEESGENRSFIMSVAPDGSDQRTLIGPEHVPGIPSYSPDGTKLAFGCDEGGTFEGSLCIADANGSNIERVIEGFGTKDPDWSPNGRRLVLVCKKGRDHGVCVVDADGSGLKLVSHGGLYPAWGQRNLLAYNDQVGRRSGLVVSRPDGTRKRLVVRSTDKHGVAEVDWHPNGRKLVYSAGNNVQSTPPSIFVVHKDGTGRRKIVTGTEPAVSPDGRWILFTGSRGIYAIRFDGTGKRLVVEDEERWNSFMDWQPLPD